jgi:hypothetical protein
VGIDSDFNDYSLTHYHHQDEPPFQNLSALTDAAPIGCGLSPFPRSGAVFVATPIEAFPIGQVSFTYRFGLPGEAWKSDVTRKHDLFIEAQVWLGDLSSRLD